MLNIDEIIQILDTNYLAETLAETFEEQRRNEMLFQTMMSAHTAIESSRLTKKVKKDTLVINDDIKKVHLNIMKKLNNDLDIINEEIKKIQ